MKKAGLRSITAFEHAALAHNVIDGFLPATGDLKTKTPTTTADGYGAARLDVSSKAELFVSECTGERLHLIVNNGKLQIIGGDPLMAVTDNPFRNPRGDLFFMS